MKLAARCLAALAVLAFATPALPCGDKPAKTTTASTSMEKAPAGAVAKSGATAKKAGSTAKPAGEARPAAAD